MRALPVSGLRRTARSDRPGCCGLLWGPRRGSPCGPLTRCEGRCWLGGPSSVLLGCGPPVRQWARAGPGLVPRGCLVACGCLEARGAGVRPSHLGGADRRWGRPDLEEAGGDPKGGGALAVRGPPWDAVQRDPPVRLGAHLLWPREGCPCSELQVMDPCWRGLYSIVAGRIRPGGRLAGPFFVWAHMWRFRFFFCCPLLPVVGEGDFLFSFFFWCLRRAEEAIGLPHVRLRR
ncbi:hypothetical protein NDU88_006029 [Pleurodeles waltl]|uniref:Uncharacterized protein n=1 Tax=Pleurodeles waltl TaxID=8319 RepID=A0AAV7W9M3_PLEWA|nr:hypothetical protein NDU88_006029 [Pleurodeles waltl]